MDGKCSDEGVLTLPSGYKYKGERAYRIQCVAVVLMSPYRFNLFPLLCIYTLYLLIAHLFF